MTLLENHLGETFVLFELAGTTYAVPSSDVRQLEMIEHITPVPNAPEAVEGVMFSRGQVIPALSLRRRFGFPKTDYDLRSRLVVVSVGERTLGLIVDSAREFKRIPIESISPPPETIAETTGKYISGITSDGDRLILILDLAELIKEGDGIQTESNI
jgi:purine-binding chemotaxis protein CheW